MHGTGLMADRDNPKLSLRPLSKPKPAAPAATGEDQLAESARMVSGRPIVDPARAIRGKTVPVTRAASSGVVVNELEAKLLDDLEALSSIFYAQSSPAPVPSAQPAKPAPPASAAAPRAKPQPAAPPAMASAAPPVAAAPPPAPAPAVLAPQAERQAPAVSPTYRPPVGGATGVTVEKLEKGGAD